MVWCNLCRAVGDTFMVYDDDGTWMSEMQKHTELRHPEHEAALRRGETYEPVEVAP